ncbi:hypothetical protein GGI43DRAFT_392641 [Trichoderma evansii]
MEMYNWILQTSPSSFVDMSTMFAMVDLSTNYSFYMVPAAFTLCWLPAAYGHLLAGKHFDETNPRHTQAAVLKDDKMDKARQQRITRALSAMENGFESLGMFAGGVAAANYAGVDVYTLNLLTIEYVCSRVLYIFVYIVLCENGKLSPLRTLSWLLGVVSMFALWIMAGLKAGA